MYVVVPACEDPLECAVSSAVNLFVGACEDVPGSVAFQGIPDIGSFCAL